MVGGTTDSNAAFFAAAGARPEFGQAVTSLGSTVALKQLSKSFVEDASRGVYSHRFPRFGSNDESEEEEAWLIGGASNVGCAVLRQEEFSNEELATLSSEIDPDSDSPLSYYPLTKKGERFPIADSDKEPILDPKPDSRKDYLHGILQAIGDVERDGYRILGELGASPSRPTEILTCGGGSKNDMWTAMRERRLRDICNEEQRIVVKKALNTEASYGAALLAAASFE
jgi:sugar (pentulose or hexulose) kinase